MENKEIECKTIEQPHSTEISINAKGMWSGSVKVYGTTCDEAFEKALIKANALDQLIRNRNNDPREA